MSDGVRPTLAELVALRAAAGGRRTPPRGRHGLHGHGLSPLRGRGMEYAESREYAHGDDARHIDWRLTARSGRAHTKLFQAERERLTLVVADTAPALYFGTRTRFKSVQAARAGALAAWVAVRDGDRIAALRGAAGEAPVPPASGPRGALRVLDALVRWYAAPPADDAGLPFALDHAARLLRPGSRLVVLADPSSLASPSDAPAPWPLARWADLSRHHEIVVLLMVDALERQPPAAPLVFAAPDGAAAPGRPGRLELDLSAPAQRDAWEQAFGAPVARLLADLPRHGVRVDTLATDAPSDAWLPLLGRGQARVA